MVPKLREGELPADHEIIALAISVGSRAILKRDRTAWQPVFDRVADYLDAVAQEGGESGDYVKLLQDVAAGLRASAPNFAAEDVQAPMPRASDILASAMEITKDKGFDPATIIMIVKMVLEIIEAIWG
jgi:hypothetical protein